MLYDFYYKLLTKKQQSYMEMYYREDYSLGVISELTNVSRQAVYDTIKRTEQLLQSYEVHLSLYSKFKTRQQLIEDLYQQVHSKNQDILDIIQRLLKIASEEFLGALRGLQIGYCRRLKKAPAKGK